MGWLKVDDKLPRNPKILAADAESAWWYVCALAHCAEQLTDGYIAESAVPVIAPHITDPQAIAARCVTLDLLERVAGGYQVPDYLDFNPSRDQVVAEREAARRRKQDQRSREQSRRDSQRTDGGRSASPSRPVPESVGSQSSTGDATGDELSTGPVFEAIADRKLAQASGVKHPDRWRAKALSNARTELGDKVADAVRRWPTAPAPLLAGYVLGEDARSLSVYEARTA